METVVGVVAVVLGAALVAAPWALHLTANPLAAISVATGGTVVGAFGVVLSYEGLSARRRHPARGVTACATGPGCRPPCWRPPSWPGGFGSAGANLSGIGMREM